MVQGDPSAKLDPLGLRRMAEQAGQEELAQAHVQGLNRIARALAGQVCVTFALVQMVDALRLQRVGGQAKQGEVVAESAVQWANQALQVTGLRLVAKEEEGDAATVGDTEQGEPPDAPAPSDGSGD